MTPNQSSNPYPGLRPFRESEAHLFFGRDALVDEMLVRLARSRFLGVVGASGSGKSSLINAGLVPRLRGDLTGEVTGGWRVVTMRPWNDPLGRLAAELLRPGVLSIDSTDPVSPLLLETTLRRSGLGLQKLAARALPGDARLLVIVDQFEELFRGGSTFPATFGDDAAALVALLLEAVRTASPVWVMLSMRSDFIGDCARFHGLPELLSAHQYLVPRMTRDELVEAISAPAVTMGARVAPRLAQRLLNDVEGNQDQLPVLQHALMRMWNGWAAAAEDRPIDLVDYQAIGGVTHALSTHADQAFASLPEGRARSVAERIFRALTDQPTHAQPVRRPLRFARLLEEAGVDEHEALPVIECFRGDGRHFLVTSDVPPHPDSVVDISHESLIRLWSRLRQWLAKEAEWKRRYLELVTATRRHAAGEGSLWPHLEVALARRWVEEEGPDERWASRYGAPDDFAAARRFLSDSDRSHVAERRRRLALWSMVPLTVAVMLIGTVVNERRRSTEYAQQRQRLEEDVRETTTVLQRQMQDALENQRLSAGELGEARATLEAGPRGSADLASVRQSIDRVLARLSPAAEVYYGQQQELARLEQRASRPDAAHPASAAPAMVPVAPVVDHALRGYKVGIYFIEGHPGAEGRAQQVAGAVRTVPGVTVQLYPRNQAFMVQVNPPRGDEVRYEVSSGDERRAAEALRQLGADLGVGTFGLRPVTTPTPGFISIVLADGVEAR